MKWCSRGLLAASLLAVGACTDTADNADSSATSATDTGARVQSSSRDSQASVDTMVPIAEPATVDQAQLALDGEGLRVILLPLANTRLIPFGQSMDSVLRSVGTMLDDSTRTALQENADCNATAATWPSRGLTLWFASLPSNQAKRFVGWSVAGTGNGGKSTDPRLTTMSGIGIGSTRTELLETYDARIQQSSIGVEFSAGGIAGVLSSNAADARVTHIWSGQVCIAR